MRFKQAGCGFSLHNNKLPWNEETEDGIGLLNKSRKGLEE
jgi:hypothetical protein